MTITMTNSKEIIHTTGALLRPQRVIDMLGNEIWMWAVVEFTDSSFKNGEEFNPPETAESLENLLDENSK